MVEEAQRPCWLAEWCGTALAYGVANVVDTDPQPIHDLHVGIGAKRVFTARVAKRGDVADDPNDGCLELKVGQLGEMERHAETIGGVRAVGSGGIRPRVAVSVHEQPKGAKLHGIDRPWGTPPNRPSQSSSGQPKAFFQSRKATSRAMSVWAPAGPNSPLLNPTYPVLLPRPTRPPVMTTAMKRTSGVIPRQTAAGALPGPDSPTGRLMRSRSPWSGYR